MEQERLEHQRNALWVCMNIGSAVAVEVDKVSIQSSLILVLPNSSCVTRVERTTLPAMSHTSHMTFAPALQRLEMCRQLLETVDPDKDIQGFIKANGLGSVRPGLLT